MASAAAALPSGVRERRDRDGRIRYFVNLRRRGQTHSATFGSLPEALTFRAEAIAAALGEGEAPERPRRPAPPLPEPPGRAATVEDAARRLCRGMLDGEIRARDGRPYKPSVTRKYEAALRLLVVPRIGYVPLPTLRPGDVQRLVDELAHERTPEHARKALTALRVALRVAERYDDVAANPCVGVRVPASAEGERPPRILTPEQAAAIVAACEADDARLGRSFAAPLFALAFGTGLRLGELLALQWGPDGLDLDAGVVRVRRSLDRVRGPDGAYPVTAPKSRAARRDVPLPPEEVARLRRHRLATGRPADAELVFAVDGAALSPVPATRAWKRACAAAYGLEYRSNRPRDPERAAALTKGSDLPRVHDARHAYATHALRAGLSPHAVAQLLGHTDAGLVLRRYGHALPDELAGAGEALSAFRAGRSTS